MTIDYFSVPSVLSVAKKIKNSLDEQWWGLYSIYLTDGLEYRRQNIGYRIKETGLSDYQGEGIRISGDQGILGTDD